VPEHGETGTEQVGSGSTLPVAEVKIDPELLKMYSEGSIISEPTNIEHIQSSLGSQMEQVQAQMKASFSTPVIKQAARSLEQLILLVIGLQFDTSLEAIVTRCVQFLSAITEGGIVLTLNDTLMKYVAQAEVPKLFEGKTVKEIFESEQSATNEPEMLSAESVKIWETMKQGIFTKHLSYILGTVFAFSACKIKNVKFNHPVYEKVVEHASAEEIDGMDLIDHAIKLYNWTSTVGMACLESRSLEPLTVNSSTLAKCHEKYYEWQKKFLDFKRTGRSSLEERQLMYVEVETVYKTLERFVKCQKEKFMTLQASSLFREVLVLYNDVKDFVQKVDRVKVAKGYHLVGPPKAGKSTICPMIQEQICLARGVEYREQDNAQINLLAPYQDELSNATQTITVNETIPIKEHLAKSVETAYNTALALIDPVPFHPNRSNLEDKAKITLTHVGVVSTGNTAQPFINVARTPGAWERRYTIIHMTVKEQFADEFGRLESSKCDGSNDYHWFDVYEIVYINKERKIVYFTFNGKKSLHLNTEELFELIRKQCLDHFAEQDKLFASYQGDKKKGCLICHRLGTMCKCPSHETFSSDYKNVGMQEASVYTNTDYPCKKGVTVGDRQTPCKFLDGKCVHCAFPDPDYEEENEPEMNIVSTALTTVGSLMWTSILPWVNPFVKAQWLWSIDNNTMRVFHEEIVEELSYWPDMLGCTALSLVPENWERRPDGSQTWFGKKKDAYLRMMAAEKQIFLPLSYLFRRAFCIGLMFFFVLLLFGYIMEQNGFNPRSYVALTKVERTAGRWDYLYWYPEYSPYVMERKEYYATLGIYTIDYLDWKDYYVNIYTFQKVLGRICIPWYFRYTIWVPVLVTRTYAWWLMPSIVACSTCVFLFLFMWHRRWLGFNQRYKDLQRRCSSDPNLQKSLYDKARRHPSEYNHLVPTAIGVIGAVVTGLVIWNSMRSKPEVEIDRENKTSAWNSWFSFNREVAAPQEAKNHSADEVISVLRKAMVEVKATVNGKERFIQAVFTRPGVLMIPRHFFKPDPYKEELVDYLELYVMSISGPFKVRAYASSLVRVAEKDMVLLKMHKCPKIPKGIDYLLPKNTGSGSIKSRICYYKDKKIDQEILNSTYMDDVDCGGFSCGRGLYYISKVTRKGFCGAILMSDRRDGAILGFHISGAAYGLTSRKGFAQEILFSDYEKALKTLEESPSYLSTPEMRDLCTTRLGLKLITGEGPHPKTSMFKEGEMEEYHCMEVLGHTTDLVKYRSRVKRSMLSESIEDVFGEKCRWKAPCLKQPWIHHNKAIQFVAKGAWEVPPESLCWAVEDWWSGNLPTLDEHIKQHPDLCRPLTLDEAINGVPGSLFMNPFKMDTAAGLPAGTKESSGLFLPMQPYSDGRKRYCLSPEAQRYFDMLNECLDNGVFIGIWVRTCLKDEVVAEDSEKVRIFYILECLFALSCRQTYLPVCEYISRHPITSECMVGVNCASSEWETVKSYLEEVAPDGKETDWDFKKYDLGRPSDVMSASGKLKIRVADRMKFPEKTLARMRGIHEELRNPIVNWNGTVLWMYMWCSGNTLTVYGNSLENSLHQRISFHWNGTRLLGEEEFAKLGSFKDNEHLITYGDDGESACRPEVRDIAGFHAKKAYFDFIGMQITSARKEADPPNVVDSAEIDFLKRKSVYHDELQCRVGALDKESIWKMGHMSSSSEDPEDLAIAAIQSMLTEAFLHGEDFYEYLRTGLQQCAKRNHIWTDVLERTYQDKVDMWWEKYGC
jgi:hypothetical protein